MGSRDVEDVDVDRQGPSEVWNRVLVGHVVAGRIFADEPASEEFYCQR